METVKTPGFREREEGGKMGGTGNFRAWKLTLYDTVVVDYASYFSNSLECTTQE